MEKFDLDDIQTEIDNLSKKKDEIDKKIEGLKVAMEVLGCKKSVSTTNEFEGMTIGEVCIHIINENNGIKSGKIIKIAQDGGANFETSSFRAILSRLVSSNKVKTRKRKGINTYYPIKEGNNTLADEVLNPLN